MWTTERIGELALDVLEETFNDLITLPDPFEEDFNKELFEKALDRYYRALNNALDFVKNSDSW